MHTSTAQSRTPAQTPTPPTSQVAPAAPASNQEVQEAAGLAGPTPQSGAGLVESLVLMGPVGAVVLDALGTSVAIAYAIQLLQYDWAREWLAENALPALASLSDTVQEQIIDALLPPGASFEQELVQELVAGLGARFSGAVRLSRRFGTWELMLRGELAGVGKIGLGAELGAGRAGVEAELEGRVESGYFVEAHWVLSGGGVQAARAAVLRALLGGTPPALADVSRASTDGAPDRLEAGVAGQVSAGAAVGLDTSSIFQADGVSAGVLGTDVAEAAGAVPVVEMISTVQTVVAKGLRGLSGSIVADVSAMAGYDPDPYVAVEGQLAFPGQAFGSEGGSTMGLRAVAYVMVDERGVTIVGGTVSAGVKNNGDSTQVEQPFNGSAGLLEKLGQLGGGDAAEDVGELVIEQEHKVDNTEALEAVVGPLERGVDVPLVDTAGEVTARVKVRVAGDTSAAFPSARPADEEEARDQQRALAGLVTGHAYFLDEDLREAGVIDAVTLDEAVIDSKWVADVTVEAKVAVVAGGELASGMKYTYATATDVTQRVGLEGVSAMLEA